MEIERESDQQPPEVEFGDIKKKSGYQTPNEIVESISLIAQNINNDQSSYQINSNRSESLRVMLDLFDYYNEEFKSANEK